MLRISLVLKAYCLLMKYVNWERGWQTPSFLGYCSQTLPPHTHTPFQFSFWIKSCLVFLSMVQRKLSDASRGIWQYNHYIMQVCLSLKGKLCAIHMCWSFLQCFAVFSPGNYVIFQTPVKVHLAPGGGGRWERHEWEKSIKEIKPRMCWTVVSNTVLISVISSNTV